MIKMVFNTVGYNIFGILPYHFWALIGFTVSICVGMVIFWRSRLNVTYAFYSMLLSLLGMFVGAAFLGAIYNLIYHSLLNGNIVFSSLFKGGIVYYGGLTGFVISYLFILRNRDEEVRILSMDILPLLITLFHTFARIGCFTAGCCYGIATDKSWGVIYTNLINGVEVTQRRIPTQLIESGFEFIMFVFLLILFIYGAMKGKLIWLYLSLYSVYRFFAEFYRGDWDRNVFRFLSLSQIYSFIVLFVSITLFIRSYFAKALSKEGRLV